MNEEIKPSGEVNIDIGPLADRLTNISKLYTPKRQEVIMATEDRMLHHLQEYKDYVIRRRSWVAPLSVFVPMVLALVTSSFKNFALVGAAIWRYIFIVGAAVCFAWLTGSSVWACRAKEKDMIGDLKKESGETLIPDADSGSLYKMHQ